MKTIIKLLCALSTFGVVLGAPEEPKAGSVDKDGDLIIHVFHSCDHPPVPLPVKLKDAYAFMIFNVGTLEEPKLEVKIASKKDKKIQDASSWEEVSKILATIPKGSKINYYGTCLCPTYYGLPKNTWDRFIALAKKQKLVYDEEHDRITCTCFQQGG